MWQISYPPANGASHGNYFLLKSHKLAFEEKKAYENSSRSETDRQTDKFFDTIYGECRFFLSAKFVTSLLASLAGGKQL